MMRSIKDTVSVVEGVLKRIDVYKSNALAQSSINLLIESDDIEVLSFVNAHALNVAALDSEFEKSLMHSSLLLRDGVGVEVMLNALSMSSGYNLNGTDLIPSILKQNQTAAVAVFGTQEPYLSAGVKALREQGTNIVCSLDGFEPEQDYIALARQHPDLKIIVLAMGMPKQERLAQLLKEDASTQALIINGGAVIDFLGGKVSRAPQWVQYCKGEWLYRLAREPSRMWSRYVTGGIISFLYLRALKKLSRLTSAVN